MRKIAPKAPANFDMVDCIDPLLPDWDVLVPVLLPPLGLGWLSVLVGGLAGVEEEVAVGIEEYDWPRTPLARATGEVPSIEF